MRALLLVRLLLLTCAHASVEKRFARLEQRVAFLHARMADLICEGRYESYDTASGAWCLKKAGELNGIPMGELHFLDRHIAKTLLRVVGPTARILDVGAGAGQCWRSRNAERGSEACTSVDGALNVEAFTNGRVRWADLTQPLLLDDSPFEWVVSLEVGEHLPQLYEAQFFRTLDKHNTCGVALSWAVEGQPGKGHVNCRSNEYVSAKMRELGYSLDNSTMAEARAGAEWWWFKNSFMLFRRDSAAC